MLGFGLSLSQVTINDAKWWPNDATMMIDFENSRAMLDSRDVSLDNILSVTRASASHVKDVDGKLIAKNTNELALSNTGLQIEPSATNLIIYSDAFDHSWWNKNPNIAITANSQTAPNMTVTADTLEKTATDTYKAVRRQNITVTTATTYTASLFVKKGTLNVMSFVTISGGNDNRQVFNLDTNSISDGSGHTGNGFISATIEDYYDDWKRVTLTATTSGTALTVAAYPGDLNVSTTGTVYIWGAQLEQGEVATSYIETSGSAATRQADDIAYDNSSWLNYTQPGTFVSEATIYQPETANQTFYLLRSRADSNNTISIGNQSTAGDMKALITASGATQANIGGTYAKGIPFKLAFAYDTNDAAASFNAAAPSTDTTVTLPSGTPSIGLGNDLFSSDYFNGLIKNIIFFNTRQSNTFLQSISS
ncbi:MAG: hypothetical protein AAF228_06255 [Pseudomonadota bacterium]